MPEKDNYKCRIAYITDRKSLMIFFPDTHSQYWIEKYIKMHGVKIFTQQELASITIDGTSTAGMERILSNATEEFKGKLGIVDGEHICTIKHVDTFKQDEVIKKLEDIFGPISKKNIQIETMSLDDLKQKDSKPEAYDYEYASSASSSRTPTPVPTPTPTSKSSEKPPTIPKNRF